jgi:GT2 family glycosyltransferase
MATFLLELPSQESSLESADATIIVVSFNSHAVIDACLRSLQSLTAPAGEVIVVDNASADGSADLIEQSHPGVRLIRSATNLGFGPACNLALGRARGRLPVLLNPDTEVEPGWLQALEDAMRSDRKLGIVGSKILEPDGHTVQHLGGILHSNALSDHLGRGALDVPSESDVRDCDYVTGASMALRREMLRQVGGFDLGFFPAYFEETDLCWRARRSGWRVAVATASRLRHLEAAASGKLSADFLRHYHRNRIHFVLKNYGWRSFWNQFWPAERQWIRSGNATESLPALRYAWLTAVRSLPRILWSRSRQGPRLSV